MFGYVFAHRDSLTESQLARYKQYYCGLCRSLRLRHGLVGEATLTYDMTFLVMLLDSLYEPEPTTGQERCLMHPIHVHDYSVSKYTEYAADLNVALVYYSCLDDWQDDRSLPKLAAAKLLHKKMVQVSAQYSRQCGNIQFCLNRLRQIEQAQDPSPDAAANCFGDLMAELFVVKEDIWAPTLRQVGAALGRFIYVMDAVMDLDGDRRSGNYNPMIALADSGQTMEDFIQILTMLISECTTAFEKLPLVQDVEILRNILYTGVWTKLYTALQQDKKDGYQ